MAANVLKVALNVSVFHGENTRYLNYVYKSWVKLKEHKHSSTSTEKKKQVLITHQLVSCINRFYSHRFNVFVAISKFESWDIISREVSVEKNIDLLLVFVLRKKLHGNLETFT